MGSFSSAVSSIMSVAKAVNSADTLARDRQALAIKDKQLMATAEQQKQKNLLDLQKSESDRVRSLKKAITTQRAKFGSFGTGGTSGSAEAVLDGINANSNVEYQQNTARTALDNAAIDDNLGNQLQLNLLQKQQLRQKSNLALLDGIF